MDKTPHGPDVNVFPVNGAVTEAAIAATEVISTDWRDGLPLLVGRRVALREMRKEDAPSLVAFLNAEEVSRFTVQPPGSIDAFERFIKWAHYRRAHGSHACFAVTLAESDTPIGIFQLRSIDTDFATAEWGFALGSPFWGTGLFLASAKMTLDFAFQNTEVNRLEARAVVQNSRGNGALRKLGAVQEGVLRRSFLKNGEYLDQALWTILEDEWMQAKTVWSSTVVH
jgi:RimJ/RimL family protein N-acetyltransferase